MMKIIKVIAVIAVMVSSVLASVPAYANNVKHVRKAGHPVKHKVVKFQSHYQKAK